MDRRHGDGRRDRPGDRDRSWTCARTAGSRRGGQPGSSSGIRPRPKDIGNQTRTVLSRRDLVGAAMTDRRPITGRPQGRQRLADANRAGRYRLPGRRHGCLEAAARVSSLTHDDERAAAGLRLWSFAIRHAVLHGTFDGVRDYLDRGRPRDRRLLGSAARRGRDRHAASTSRTTAGWSTPCRPRGGRSPMPAASGRRPTCPRRLELAVRAGHDTDTTAAIAGGAARGAVGGVRGACPVADACCTAGRVCEPGTFSSWPY